jgi:hypothetical protein
MHWIVSDLAIGSAFRDSDKDILVYTLNLETE